MRTKRVIRKAASTTMRPFLISYFVNEDRSQAALVTAKIWNYVAAGSLVRVDAQLLSPP